MRKYACFAMWLILALPASAQVTIQNPKKLPVPEARVAVIYDVVRRLVFEEVKPVGGKPVNLKLTLALAVRPQAGYLTNEDEGTVEIYLDEWDENRFAQAVMALSMQLALPVKRRREILQEAQRRADLLAPVDVGELKNQNVSARPLATPAPPDPSLSLTCPSSRIGDPACRRVWLPTQFDSTPEKRPR